MNVKQLRELLENYPDDMDVIVDMYSDYTLVDEVKLIKAVKCDWGVMRSHKTMSEANKANEKEFLLIDAHY